MNEMKRNGMKVFGNALKVTLGAGAALGSTYLLCRIKDKQESETSLSRLEKMLEELLGSASDTPTTKDIRK